MNKKGFLQTKGFEKIQIAPKMGQLTPKQFETWFSNWKHGKGKKDKWRDVYVELGGKLPK